jgi:paraquat-inducible protein B
MSEYPVDPREHERNKEEAAEARVTVGRWNPWVWIVPVLAIFFVGWLIVRYGMGGGDITVRFAEARGLDRYSPVRFRGAKVGTVQKISVDENLHEVVVRISMDASMNHALRKGTRFWVVEPGIEGGGLGGLLSGTYVGIAPGPAGGEETREFAGQEYAPVLSAPEAGKTVILEGNGAGSITIGAPVEFQGMRVGRILGSEYDPKREVTSVYVFVVQRFAHHVRQSTRFWRGGGLSLSLGGGGVSMGDVSLASLLNAPISFYTPEIMAGDEVANGTRFELQESRAAAIATADGPYVTYLTYFTGAVGGLATGTPVRMKGVEVGRVRDVRLRYLPQTATLETPVMLTIDPRLLEIAVNDATTREELRRTMDGAIGALVRKGMRASLATSIVLPGASGVNLDVIAAPNTGRLVLANDPPIIPSATGDNGLGSAMASLTKVADKIGNLPIEEIAGHLRSTATRLDTLVHDPRLDQSLDRLNSSLADVEKVTATARQNAGPIVKSVRNAAESAESAAATAKQNVEPLVQSLRNAASSAEAAAKSAEQIVGGSQKQNYDVAELIKELTRAAEAVRSLATYLTENPDSLIKGRREK